MLNTRHRGIPMKAPFSTRFLISSLILLAGLEAQAKFVYTNNDLASSNSVSGFSVDANGVLTQIAGSPFSTGGSGMAGGAFAVTRIATSGTFMYASNGGSHNIAAFSISTGTGSLSSLSGSPYAAGTAAGDISLTASLDGKYLFAALSSNNAILTFQIGSDGSLSQVASASAPAVPTGIKIS